MERALCVVSPGRALDAVRRQHAARDYLGKRDTGHQRGWRHTDC